MDFSEIGVKSRKTGIVARDNVRRDENDMEDVDDFFRDEQPTINNNNNTERNNNNNNNNRNNGTLPHRSGTPNGKIIFPSSNLPGSPASRLSTRNSPLRSPLQTRLEQLRDDDDRISSNNDAQTNDDLFTDAHEQPTIEDDGSNDSMEIDDESKGTIKVINNDNSYHDYDYDYDIQEDNDKVSIPISNSTPNASEKKGQKLFASSSDDDDTNTTEQADRRRELERNISVRSPSKRKGRSSSPPRNQITQTSPLASSKLHSPLQPRKQPTARSIASLTKNIALHVPSRNKLIQKNKNHSASHSPQDEVQRTPSAKKRSKANISSDDDSEYEEPTHADADADDSQDESSPRRSSPLPTDTESDNASIEYADDTNSPEPQPKKLKTHIISDEDVSDDETAEVIPNQTRGRGRARRSSDSGSSSPSRSISAASRRHVLDVKTLQAQQSRSSSRYPEESTATRRSSRIRVPPLAFWRNEKAVYEKKRGDVVPTLKEIITVDEVVEPLKSRAPSRRGASRRPSSRPSPKSQPLSRKRSERSRPLDTIQDDNEDEDIDPDQDDGEEAAISSGAVKGSEWLKNGFLKVDTFEGHGSDEKAKRLIAWAPGTENFTSSFVSATDNFKLAILFDKNREFIATGMMLIPPGGVKSLKSTDSTYFVFYCISGVIEVTLSGSVFFIKKGCSLEVPMGNFYQFVNKGKKDATLFFVQTRGHDVDDWDE